MSPAAIIMLACPTARPATGTLRSIFFTSLLVLMSIVKSEAERALPSCSGVPYFLLLNHNSFRVKLTKDNVHAV